MNRFEDDPHAATAAERPALGEALGLLIALPFMVGFGALVHAGAHGVAALLRGGLSAGVGALTGQRALAADPLVAMAPTLTWACLLVGVALVGGVARPSFGSRALVAFGVALPLLDASWGAAGLFLGVPTNDWHGALGGAGAGAVLAWGLYVVALSEVGWRLVRRAWAGRVSPALYTAAFVAILVSPWIWLALLILGR